MNISIQSCLLTLLAICLGLPGHAMALSPKYPGGNNAIVHITFRKVHRVQLSGLTNKINPPEYLISGMASSTLATHGASEGQLVPRGKRIKVSIRGKQPQAKNCIEMAEKKFNNDDSKAVLGFRGTVEFNKLKIDYDKDEIKAIYVELADVLGCALVKPGS